MALNQSGPLPAAIRKRLGRLYVAIEDEAGGNATHSVLLLQCIHDAIAARAKLLQRLSEPEIHRVQR
ncbi:MAG: hypothetical protein USCAAHI_01753 [Beijerinckiaceae bacterium]|nr:MAG: hypothetical protein USCAAHI_01753 [Beijerinckiaceae bacterium]